MNESWIEKLKTAGYSVTQANVGWTAHGVKESNQIWGSWKTEADAWQNCDKDWREKERAKDWSDYDGRASYYDFLESFEVCTGGEYPATIEFIPSRDICGEGYEGYNIRYKFEDTHLNSSVWDLEDETGVDRKDATRKAFERYDEIVKFIETMRMSFHPS